MVSVTLYERRSTTQLADHQFNKAEAAAAAVPRNAAGVQLLSPHLAAQVFGTETHPDSQPTTKAIEISLAHLHKHGLALKESPALPSTSFDLPQLQGDSIASHFESIASHGVQPYANHANQLARSDLPPRPDSWLEEAGWVKYHPDGRFERVSWPDSNEGGLVFDVETMYRETPFACMATAASSSAWYAWISPWLLGQSDEKDHLIPMPADDHRIVVGHNIGYDRARLQEEYALGHHSNSVTRFIDTMSLHAACNGLSSPQRPAWIAHRKNKLAKAARSPSEEEGAGADGSSPSNSDRSPVDNVVSSALAGSEVWQDVSSLNSLAEVARLHCGIEVDKEIRDVFGSHSPEEVRESIQDLLSYCADDVDITHKVFQKVWPQFREACPSNVTLGGVLTMGKAFLPVDERWEQFIDDAERTYEGMRDGVDQGLAYLAQKARTLMHRTNSQTGEPAWKGDSWMEQLDWEPKSARRQPLAQEQEDFELALAEGMAPSAQPQQPDAKGTTESPATGQTPSLFASTSANNIQTQHPKVEATADSAATEQTSPPVASSSATSATTHQTNILSSALSDPRDPQVLPFLLRATWKGLPVRYSLRHGFYVFVPKGTRTITANKNHPKLGNDVKDNRDGEGNYYQITTGRAGSKVLPERVDDLLGDAMAWVWRKSPVLLEFDNDVAGKDIYQEATKRATEAGTKSLQDIQADPWLRQLLHRQPSREETLSTAASIPSEQAPPVTTSTEPVSDDYENIVSQSTRVWPKWYWDLDRRPSQGEIGLHLSVRTRIAPLLLRLIWRDRPMFFSKQHGWTFSIEASANKAAYALGEENKPLAFKNDKFDGHLFAMTSSTSGDQALEFYKLPHHDGGDANVGNPLSKGFVAAFEDGRLSAKEEGAKSALEMNAKCSYWVSARERVMKQMVVWQDGKRDLTLPEPLPSSTSEELAHRGRTGLILPPVVTMGTVTRRAVENTWLTASNAKPSRVGSELKSLIRAPEGYTIVGADVDSEELWICAVMGDAYFGMHGATALGWMTLEGSKGAGTDMHSVTAKILGISRDGAKVFNYSRIYGAGVKHAVDLLKKGNPDLSLETAEQSAKDLYVRTKGMKRHKKTYFSRKFWYAGTESHVFNMLESIAMSRSPQTPTLGCGVTKALKKSNLPKTEDSKAGEAYLPSRINWVVQSSGVDYLHLLLVAVEYLISQYQIDAKYLISVHDDLRYLVKDEDKYRFGLALQIANLWTRAMFAYSLGIDNLPQVCTNFETLYRGLADAASLQSCAFFSAIDFDHVLRKEVSMTCLTPSSTAPIPPGEALDIEAIISKTKSGSLHKEKTGTSTATPQALRNSASMAHIKDRHQRRSTTRFLLAQSCNNQHELETLIKTWKVEDEEFW